MKFPMKSLLLWLMILCLTPAFALCEDTEETQLTYSRYINVPGVGDWYYYAQNDPEWDQSFYETYN